VKTTALKTDIRKLSLDELITYFAEIGEPKFRAKQVHEWLWQKSALDFDSMSNLSKDLRQKLTENFGIYNVTIQNTQKSNDGTLKFAFKLHDDHIVEGVLIPTEKRMTACISSQVGCSLACKFCATGYMERKRNLHHDEVYDQVVLIKQQAEKHYGKPLTNIVLMGMGEPLLNYKNVLKGIDLVCGEDGLHLSYKRVTLSTAGIAKLIKKLGDDDVKFNLALSLHAANDEKRSKIMPINDQNNLKALKEALMYFVEKTNNQLTFEYIVFNGINDDIIDAKELVTFCSNLPSKVNIIEYNPIDNAHFLNAEADKISKFATYLRSKNIITSVRRSRGKDIDAACGQLANKN